MQYDVKTPEEYFRELPDDWRRSKVVTLSEIIKARAPMLTEKISYKMLAYGNEDDLAFCLNAQKNYVSLYVGNASKIDPDGQLLKGLNVGKGCVRFSKSTEIADTRIDEFIARAAEMWQRGEDFGC